MSVKDQVGAERYEGVKATLKRCWPDEKSSISDAMVDELFALAKHEWKAESLEHVDVPIPEKVLPKKSGKQRVGYYVGYGTHERRAAPWSAFTGELPLVRISIPNEGTSGELSVLETEAGDVWPEDRLFPSIDVLWARYGDDPKLEASKPKRVDLITPPRLKGARFGAIAVYLCYENDVDATPAFYVLEAGLATGQPRIPYLGRSWTDPIVSQSHYTPTPFSGPSHWYRGLLTMCPDVPDDPKQLKVEVFREGPDPLADPYMTVTVAYERRDEPLMTNPFFLQVAAGARLTLIADALGVDIELPQQWFLKMVAHFGEDELFDQAPSGD